ncbi:MAG: AMP-binding protein, partial [bacterium]|nr:AMP-binding protein [bacterium]
GYLGRPGLTAEKFIPSPFGEEPGGRLYKTGDLARYLPDGGIDFLGRIDHQVKIRGFRIELGEIETALGRHPGVREAAVVVRDDEGDRRLVAYVARTEDSEAFPPGELRAWLGETLPEYMVPSAVVLLDTLPLTAHGKVDRAALPAPEPTAGAPADAGAAPRDPLEEILAGIWSQLLGIEGVGVHDDFFELGGHSLLATRLQSRVRRDLGVELPLRVVFEQPTVAGLAAWLGAAWRREEGLEAPPLCRVARRDQLPLSFAQQRLWFLDRLESGSAVYNIPSSLALTGRLHRRALSRALSEIVRRHEVLRTRFATVDGEPYQVIEPECELPLPIVDLGALGEPERG